MLSKLRKFVNVTALNNQAVTVKNVAASIRCRLELITHA